MIRYTANYTYTDSNFVIQNLEGEPVNTEILPLLYVAKNILQRGNPTIMSKFLQNRFGRLHEDADYSNTKFSFISKEPPIWSHTIRGSENSNPAEYFFYELLPNILGEYSFLQKLILPEASINEITNKYNERFGRQQVDFYLPVARLVIEIDGNQHEAPQQKLLDIERDSYLSQFGIKTIRLKASIIGTNSPDYIRNVNEIHNRIHEDGFFKTIKDIKESYSIIDNNLITSELWETKIRPTAVLRMELLFLDLLILGKLPLSGDWELKIRQYEELGDYVNLAFDDLYCWLNSLNLLLNKNTLPSPVLDVKIQTTGEFTEDPACVNIDFSLFKRWTDENEENPNIIYVRTDYYSSEDVNYFKVSTSNPINYRVREEDKENLEFFLQNIFGKEHFREGQFPIIQNALNLNDTIGLLPTGGGKSLCYQLPCILQPAINFVVCPIKSLMYDQCVNMKNLRISNVSSITGDLKADERKSILDKFSNARFLFVWISPERFQIQEFRDQFQKIIDSYSIAYAVIDEVHCLSEWGHDFRTSYLNLAKTIDKFSHKDKNGEGSIKFIGLTATASPNVLKDIRIEFSRQSQSLADENIKSLLDYSRQELEFYVENDNCRKFDKLKEVVSENSLFSNTENATILFTPFVNGGYGCYGLYNNLSREFQEYSEVMGWFSGECPKNQGGNREPIMDSSSFREYKQTIQNEFKDNRKYILCATKAFGMGIDKDNIHHTIHFGIPGSVESLYQEAGRAGRWANKDIHAKCYVLYSPVANHCREQVAEIWQQQSSVLDAKETLKRLDRNSDLSHQLFLFLSKLKDPKDEYVEIMTTISSLNLCDSENQEIIFQYNEGGQYESTLEDLEKIVYRLTLLGIFIDWTVDFNTHTIVAIKGSVEKDCIVKSLQNYIGKYESNTDLELEIEKIEEQNIDTFLKKSVWYLVNWIYSHIVYSRKQSLKTLIDFCDEYTDSESFKQRIDNYFTFTETTFIIQYITEHPYEYEKWIDVFYNVDTSEGNVSAKTYKGDVEINKMRDSISRFLESYENNVGLNFISGFVRLKLNEFFNSDGAPRLERAYESIKDHSIQLEPGGIDNMFERIFEEIKKHFTREQQVLFVNCTAKFFPEKLGYMITYFDLPELSYNLINNNVEKIKEINRKLYEFIGKI